MYISSWTRVKIQRRAQSITFKIIASERLTSIMLFSGGGHRTGLSISVGSAGCSTASKLSKRGTPCSAAAGLILFPPTPSTYTINLLLIQSLQSTSTPLFVRDGIYGGMACCQYKQWHQKLNYELGNGKAAQVMTNNRR